MRSPTAGLARHSTSQRCSSTCSCTSTEISSRAEEGARKYFRSSRFSNVDNSLVELFESLPSYRDFFGGLDYCKCEHCRSILGPAAYFVDIMITEERITFPNTQPARTIPDGYTLKERRPDLFEIELTLERHEAL